MVEFGLILPVLMLFVWGIIDFGRLMVTSSGLTNAAREGARYAAVLQNPTTTTSTAAIKQIVRKRFVPLGGDTLIDSQISVSQVTTSPATVTVTITNYPWKTITPLGGMVSSMSTTNFTRSATFRWEWGP
jgi:Flp pilus assembly protein TadG